MNSLLKATPLLLLALSCSATDGPDFLHMMYQEEYDQEIELGNPLRVTEDDLNFRQCKHENCCITNKCYEGCRECDGTGRVYLGNPDIAPEHRTAPTVLVIGMPGKGKSTLCRLLTGATQTSRSDILRQPAVTDPFQAGQRAPAGLKLFHHDSSAEGCVTNETSVVETHLVPKWDSEEPGHAAPIVIVDTPGIGNVTSMVNITDAMEFQTNIMESTLHINNSYGGINRFIICERADESRRDDSGMLCIKHLAAAFGGEMNFMHNLSMVFTHSDRILSADTTADREEGIKKVLGFYEQALYRVSDIARENQFKLVYAIEADTDNLKPNDIPCYFMDSKQAQVLLEEQKTVTDQEVEAECRAGRKSVYKAFIQATTDHDQNNEAMQAAGWSVSRGDWDKTSLTTLKEQREFATTRSRTRVKLAGAEKNLNDALKDIRQKLERKSADRVENAERSRENLIALIDLVRGSSKTRLTMECLETLGRKYQREQEEAAQALALADERIKKCKEDRKRLDMELLKARQERNREAVAKAEAERGRVEVELREAQADRQRELDRMEAAAEKETMMKRAVGGSLGGAAIGATAVLTIMSWPVTALVAGAAAVGCVTVAARTRNSQRRLQDNEAWRSLRRVSDSLTDTLTRGSFSEFVRAPRATSEPAENRQRSQRGGLVAISEEGSEQGSVFRGGFMRSPTAGTARSSRSFGATFS